MRIVIDMQGVQTSSGQSERGLCTLALVQAVARQRSAHEVILALSGLMPESICHIRAAFAGLLLPEQIRVWQAPGPVSAAQPANHARRLVAELLREAFLASLHPDVVLMTSMFEGYADNAVTSIGRFPSATAITAILYDLIPDPQAHGPKPSPRYAQHCQRQRAWAEQAALCLATSAHARRQGLQHLGLPPERVLEAPIAPVADLCHADGSDHAALSNCLERLGLRRPFVLYSGPVDAHGHLLQLVQAWAAMPAVLRQSHQLLLAGPCAADGTKALRRLAQRHGVDADELRIGPWFGEAERLLLYRHSRLVLHTLPSDGLGLEVLEAMACGALVLADCSGSALLPELIGHPEAQFDPLDVQATSACIARALQDADWRARLQAHASQHSSQFSWQTTARRVIGALERAVFEARVQPVPEQQSPRRPRLAYVSPLPPERSGIADYSAELLPALFQHYEIEVIVAQGQLSDAWINAHCPVRSVSWFAQNAQRFDRVLYHFGNSAFHRHMPALLEAVPGVVVLHDFYLPDLRHAVAACSSEPRAALASMFYRIHGYRAVHDLFKARHLGQAIAHYPCNLDLLENSLGTIVHSRHALQLAGDHHGTALSRRLAVVPQLRQPVAAPDAQVARLALGLDAHDFVVCAFGYLGPTKLNHRLLQAWLGSKLAQSSHCKLVFVGASPNDAYGLHLRAMIESSPCAARVRITGWADQELFRLYLEAADVAVQLRAQSRGEMSRAVLDCMAYGLATVVNAHGSLAELDPEAVWMLPDPFPDQALTEALETLWREPARRQQIAQRARALILEQHQPTRCAWQHQQAIEAFYAGAQQPVLQKLLATLATHVPQPVAEAELLPLTQALASSFPAPRRLSRALLLDISCLVVQDSKTGIQRVVRSILLQCLLAPLPGVRVEPVYAPYGQGYRCARTYTAALLGLPAGPWVDEPIDCQSGDILFMLDWYPHMQTAQAGYYQQLRQQGVVVKFLVYDLLPLRWPEFFLHTTILAYSNWLHVVAQSDGAVCISKTVADDLRDWMGGKSWQHRQPYSITHFSLGADIEQSLPTRGLPADAAQVLDTLRQQVCFLMVGTLEPRKGHAQVLDAFEHLWRSGANVALLIVGKHGWKVDSLAQRLRQHEQRQQRLFWFEGCSDEFLQQLYAVSACLIAASYDEGFGLPIIEAAQHRLPVLARDTPIFREVADGQAYYFDADTPVALAEALNAWLRLYHAGQHPRSDLIPCLTWQQSAVQLLAALGLQPDQAALYNPHYASESP